METYICQQCGFFTGDFQRFKCHQVTTHEMESNELIKYTCAYCGIRVCGREKLESHLANDICGKYFMCEFCSCCYESIFALRQHTATHRGKRSRLRNSPSKEPPKKLARKTASLSVIIREQARINAANEPDALKQASAGLFFAKITPLEVPDTHNIVNPDIPRSHPQEMNTVAPQLDENEISRLIPSSSKSSNQCFGYKIIASPKKNATVHFLRDSAPNEELTTTERSPVTNPIQEIIEKQRPKMQSVLKPNTIDMKLAYKTKTINTRTIGTQNFQLKREDDFVHYNVQSMEMDIKPILDSIEPMPQNTAEYTNEEILSRVIKLESRDDIEEMEVDLSRVKQEPIDDQVEIKNEPVPVKEKLAESSSSSDTESDAWSPTTKDTPSITEWDKEVSPALYLCEYCELSTGQRRKLIRHYANKHCSENPSVKAFLPICPLCFKHFKTVECVRMHRSVIHDENAGIVCAEECQLHLEQFDTLQKKDVDERCNTATDSNIESRCNSPLAQRSTNEEPDSIVPLIKTEELPIVVKTEPLSDVESDCDLPKVTSEILTFIDIKTEQT